MPSLCCFLHPADDFAVKSLDDTCPQCGRAYGFPLTQAPTAVGPYRDLEPIGRGFYAATYRAKVGALGRDAVLKIASQAVYRHFDKNFAEECQRHKAVADGTDHLVEIRDMLDADVSFGDTTLPCHVAELEHIPGLSLRAFMADPQLCTPTAIGQIAIDMFRLLHELQEKRIYHNDLHDENIIIQQLAPAVRRPDAVDESLRAVAVDLGSTAPFDRQDAVHLGDLEAVVGHLFTLAGRLLAEPSATGDIEYRLATAIEEISHTLGPGSQRGRPIDYQEAIRRIRGVFEYVTSPWQEPAGLQRFDDAYNAQTLHPWFVNKLLVDPDGQWQSRIRVRGPQVITGMRGCGKTMLLRALQIHARAFRHQSEGTDGGFAERIRGDGYVGLYVSCTRLLDNLGDPTEELSEPYARLFAAYAREASRALSHLRQIERGLDAPLVAADAHRRLGEVCANYLGEAASLSGVASDRDLERGLQRILMSLDRGDTAHRLLANPTVAFQQLAEALLSCSEAWSGSQVLFLLDDVSTRHINESSIAGMLGTLMFSSPNCAFKMTTELATLELALKSPGLIEKASERDFDRFDLGSEVNAKLRDHRSKVKGKQFVEQVLAARAAEYRLHPNVTPAQLLGDATLESIAQNIARHPASSKEKKSAYHGLTALTALCVGDIGDVIHVYESILRRAASRRESPASPATQSESMQEYCARRLYNVSRRDGRLKDFALSFAAASHDLLVRSYKEEVRFGNGRLRQYSSIYLKISEDNTVAHRQLIELLDAGVFTLEGGPDSPRTKSHDRDPIQQFILNYRKLFGLSSFIGLAERDRFELSAEAALEWLDHPERGKEILLRNLGGELVEERYEESVPDGQAVPETAGTAGSQPMLDLDIPSAAGAVISPAEAMAALVSDAVPRAPTARQVSWAAARGAKPDTVVLGLGFEERTEVSASRLLAEVSPQHAVLVRYKEQGHAESIERRVRARVPDVRVVDYADLLGTDALAVPGDLAVIDVTGLAKPALFKAVHGALRPAARALIAHTRAQSYYPLESDIARVLRADEERDPYELMEALRSVWPGERGPYRFIRLLDGANDDSRRRVLCAAATAKAERLLTLLEHREYDQVRLVVPDGRGARANLAQLAAQVAVPDEPAAQLGSDDLTAELDYLARQWQTWYVGRKFAFEAGLTGSKMHAVACAALASACRLDQVWYVAPAEFDPATFTVGVGATTVWEIRPGAGQAAAT